MKKILFVPLVALILFQCQEAGEPVDLGPIIEAEATLYSLSQTGDKTYDVTENIIGSAKFSQQAGVVTLTIELSGMTPNTSKAVHIHNGTVNEPGRHWNQQLFTAFCNTRSLGELWAKPFAGDVGNVPIDENGNGIFSIRTDLWALNSGDAKDIIDKIVIVHEQPEDFAEECDPNHSHAMPHNNAKIGGGKIELITEVERNVQAFSMTHYPDFTVCN